MIVNKYQFDSIVSKTKKIITPILKGEENGVHLEYLALIESQLYQFHLKYGINGRQAKEILQLVLFDIKSVVDQQEYDCSKWEEECYRTCADTLEELFLPEKNPDLRKALKEDTIENDDYFELARKNIIRIYESIEYWTKESGSEGYFKFISEYIRPKMPFSKKYVVEDRFLLVGKKKNLREIINHFGFRR